MQACGLLRGIGAIVEQARGNHAGDHRIDETRAGGGIDARVAGGARHPAHQHAPQIRARTRKMREIGDRRVLEGRFVERRRFAAPWGALALGHWVTETRRACPVKPRALCRGAGGR